MQGFINLFKPQGVSSHDMVDFIRKKLATRKVGHGGTLDPGATGVLVIGVGKATRLLEYVVSSPKKYKAEITFGIATNTGDIYGEITKKDLNVSINKNELVKTLKNFTGDILQIPPMTSAIKYKGKKLYELARQGIEIERKPRKVTIYSLDLLNFIEDKFPKAEISVSCSKGTYIRSLCNDIGEAIGTGAHMSYLTRTAVGDFTIENSYTPEKIEELVKMDNYNFLLPLNASLGRFKKITVEDTAVQKLLNGLSLTTKDLLENDYINEQKVQLCNSKGEFLAIGKVVIAEKTYIKPVKVFKN